MTSPTRAGPSAADSDVPERGLWVLRASRLEALLDPLVELLDAAPPRGLLAPAELVTAHSGMRRWLLNRIAERAGRHGIAANLDVALPGQWIDRLCRTAMPELAGAGPSYGGDALRWALFDLLDAVADGSIDAPRLAAYLGDVPGDDRRWHLAASIAGLFGRFLVYRPDWLAAWRDGRDDVPEPGELGAVWRALRDRVGTPHRSERHAALLRAASSSDSEAAPLHLFGISHLPPKQLEVFRAVSRDRLVVLYCPDPCIEHWSGLGNERAQIRRLIDAAPGADTELLHLDTGHPLLAALGKLGQQFGALLASAEEDIVVDIRHSLDLEPPAKSVAAVRNGASGKPSPPNTLLHRVQESVRRMQPDAPPPDASANVPAFELDTSLRVYRCHSRLRELEVLREAMLQARLDDPSLSPSDMAVLAPSMAEYAPLIGAVFGPAADPDTTLPYHVADLSLRLAHPLHLAWRTLIGQARERSTAPGIVSLLRHAAIRRALDLDDTGFTTIEQMLGESAAAMGLDARSREDEGLPAIETYTLAWGLDRLCAGHAFGEDEGDALVFDGLRPAGPVRDGDVAALGALHRLLSRIAQWRTTAHRTQRASRWIDQFRMLWHELFVIDPDQRSESDAEDTLQELFAGLETSLRHARCDPDMSLAQALAMLDDALSETSQGGAFLHGAITFCGMVPQRALPFRFVAVLGLDESDYPRATQAATYDPMPRFPRLGDRDVASDDRYLFLETLMSARDWLHLSWVGEDARGGQALNPSPVLSELLDWLQDALRVVPTSPPGGDETPQLPPWLIQAPLHAFGQGGSEPGSVRPPARFAPQWFRPTPELPDAPSEGVVAPAAALRIDDLRRWLRNPAQWLLRDRWRLRLDGLEDRTLPADEPLDARVDRRLALWRQLLDQALRSGQPVPDTPSMELLAEGVLPPGPIGLNAYLGEREVAELVRRHAIELPPVAARIEPSAHVVRCESGGISMRGEVTPVFHHDGTLWLIEYTRRTTREMDQLSHQLDLLLRFALLALDPPDEADRLRAVLVGSAGPAKWSSSLDLARGDCVRLRGEMEDIVGAIATLALDADTSPLGYFPKTTRAFLRSRDTEDAWLGGPRSQGERDWSPGYAWLLAGDRAFWSEDDPSFERFAETARRLNRLIGLPAGWSAAQGRVQ